MGGLALKAVVAKALVRGTGGGGVEGGGGGGSGGGGKGEGGSLTLLVVVCNSPPSLTPSPQGDSLTMKSGSLTHTHRKAL